MRPRRLRQVRRADVNKVPQLIHKLGQIRFQSAKQAFSALAISSTKRWGVLALCSASTRSLRLSKFTSRARICRCRLS